MLRSAGVTQPGKSRHSEGRPMPSFPAGAHLAGGRNAAASNRTAAAEFYAPLVPLVVELRRQGLSLRRIAGELGHRGIPTRHGFGRWHARQVARILGRAAAEVAEE